MNAFIKKISITKLIGSALRMQWLSQDLVFTGLNQLWRIVSGPTTLLLIPLFLSPQVQGYWFTIIGLSFLMIFADLGFSNITLQFAAHEFAYLRFGRDRRIGGDKEHLTKLSSFFVFSLKWAVFVVVVAVPVISGISFLLLTRRSTDIRWFLPWLIYLIASVVVFFNNVVMYFFEGCDSVALAQRIRLAIAVVLSLIMWAGLVRGAGLYALAFSLLASAIAGSALIFFVFRETIAGLMDNAKASSYAWGGEFFPLLWRYAISWASGYFIFQIYTPLMFYYHGAVEAGRIGITIALWTAIINISLVWISSVTPRINIHVSRKEWHQLDKLFFKRMALTMLTFVLGAGAFFALYFTLRLKLNILNRFSDLNTLILLAFVWFLQTIINSLAVYLRSHKQEPLVLPSFVAAVYITVTTLLCAKYLPADYFFLGFFSSYFWTLPWVIIIYFRKRKELELKHEVSEGGADEFIKYV